MPCAGSRSIPAIAAAILAAAPSPCTGTGQSRIGRGKRRAMVVMISCSTAPLADVITPTRAGSMGRPRLADASNRPSAASLARNASMRASSAPAPAYSRRSIMSWYSERSPYALILPVAITSTPFSGFRPTRGSVVFQITARILPPSSLRLR